ncbi:LysR family transcriptional regulator [Gluconobacter thailandicus]|uniref:LysR family transcriptional regulator n=1 Tax=Gluconobacter thailandicus TaxID=257438 RepID=A0AAP9ETX5_GLUTH|nr:LysR family transcriptional regulator [Gluconobacter thailandicus]
MTGLTSGRIPLMTLVQPLSVAEPLNCRYAENALGVTQSSVSARIKAQEETLGIVLFERRHVGAGWIFLTTVSPAPNSRPEAERTRRGARGFPVLRSMRVE